MAMKLEGSVEYRAGRYIVLQDVYGHPHSVARSYCHLPERLAKVIDILILEEVSDGNFRVRKQLRGNFEKRNKFFNLCLEAYREYYRDRAAKKSESQED